MAALLVNVELPYTTGIPRDVAQNTFTISTAGAPYDEADAIVIADALELLYNDGTAGNQIATCISEVVDRSDDACRIQVREITDLLSPVHTTPVLYERTWTLNALTGSPVSLPLEVSVVSSFYSTEDASSVQVRNRRGRVYLGPLGTVILDTDGPYPVFTDSFVDLIAQRFQEFEQNISDAGFEWCVWSRTLGILSAVSGGWVNNEPDTQRRRGVDESYRKSWTNLV